MKRCRMPPQAMDDAKAAELKANREAAIYERRQAANAAARKAAQHRAAQQTVTNLKAQVCVCVWGGALCLRGLLLQMAEHAAAREADAATNSVPLTPEPLNPAAADG